MAEMLLLTATQHFSRSQAETETSEGEFHDMLELSGPEMQNTPVKAFDMSGPFSWNGEREPQKVNAFFTYFSTRDKNTLIMPVLLEEAVVQ